MCLPLLAPLGIALGASASAAAATGTVAAISLAAAAASAYGAYSTAQAGKQNAQTQAAVQRNNQQYAEWQAEDAMKRGSVEEQNQRLKTAQIKGSQEAGLSARGISLEEGSPLNILTDTAYLGERDALTIRDNAGKEAWALRESAKGYAANASVFDRSAGSYSPAFAGASTLLSSASSVAGTWYSNRSPGGGGGGIGPDLRDRRIGY